MFNEGQIFGDFEILARLGESGTGTVYKARQVSRDRLVALKTLHAALASDPEYIARFFRDAKIATGLSHPDIVQVHAAGETDGVLWLATEFVEGTTAEARLKRKGRLALPEALAIATHVATVLDYGWRTARLIHRDIEPDTIFLSKKSEVKLRGLGLAKSAGEMQSLAMNGSPTGAPHYMSPEQAEGKKDTDLRADIYSLGCTLFHFISGAPPYAGDTAMAVILKHVTAPVPELHRAFPACPVDVSRVVMKMMHKQPTGRHQTYGELITELRRCYEVLTSAPVPAAVPKPAREPAPMMATIVRETPAAKPVAAKQVQATEQTLLPVPEDDGEETPAAGKWRSRKKLVAISAAALFAVTGALFYFSPRKEHLTEAERAFKERAAEKSAANYSGSNAATRMATATPAAPSRPAAKPAPPKSAPAKIAAVKPAPEASEPAPAPLSAGPPAPATALPQSVTGKWIAEQEPQWQEAFAREVSGPFEKGVGDLRQQYLAAVEAQLEVVTKAAQLDAAVAFRAERARLLGGGAVRAEDESMAPASLRTMRAGYRTTFAKFDTERLARAKTVHARYDAILAQSQDALTQRHRLDEALEIKAKREGLAGAWLRPLASASPSAANDAPAVPAAMTNGAPVPTTPAVTPKPAPGATTVAEPRSKGPKLKPGELVARLLSMGATVSISRMGGALTKVDKMADIPGDKFTILKVEIEARDGITEGDLDVVEQLEDIEELHLNGVPATDATVKILRGFHALHSLGLRDLEKLTSAGFRSVAAMPSLKMLAVRGPISTESLAAFAGHRKLESLALSVAAFTEQDFAAIAALPALKTLTILTRDPVPPAAWARLLNAKKLSSLTVEKTPMSADAIAQISRIAGLTKLFLGDIALSDADLVPLTALKFLQSLKTAQGSTFDGSFLATCPLRPAMKTLTLNSSHTVTDKVLRAIVTGFPMLERLEIAATAGNVTPAGLAYLAKLRHLTYLSFNGDAVDAAGLAHLANCDQLIHLGLGRARAAETDIHLLAKITPLRELEWFNPPATDAAFKSYRKLRALTQFKIGTGTKPEIGDTLQAALPAVKIIR